MIFSKLSRPFTTLIAVSAVPINGAPLSIKELNIDSKENFTDLIKVTNVDDLISIQSADYDRWDATSNIGGLLFGVGGAMATIGAPMSCNSDNGKVNQACIPLTATAATFATTGAVIMAVGIIGNVNEQSLRRGDGNLFERFNRKLSADDNDTTFKASGALDSDYFGGITDYFAGHEIKEVSLRERYAENQNGYHGHHIKRLWLMDNYVFRHRDEAKKVKTLDVEDEYINAAAANITIDGISKGIKAAPGKAKEGAEKFKDGVHKELGQVGNDYQNEGVKKTIKNGIERMINRFPQPAYALFYESDVGFHVTIGIKKDIQPKELIDMLLSTEMGKPFGIDENGNFDVRFFTYSFNIKETKFYSTIRNYLRDTIKGTGEVSAAGTISDFFNSEITTNGDDKVLDNAKYCAALGTKDEEGPVGQFYLNSYGPVEDYCENF